MQNAKYSQMALQSAKSTTPLTHNTAVWIRKNYLKKTPEILTGGLHGCKWEEQQKGVPEPDVFHRMSQTFAVSCWGIQGCCLLDYYKHV